jgi:hypothetical protein
MFSKELLNDLAKNNMRQDMGRAKNAIQEYLIRKLVVPKVYLDANWSGTQVDVLAIDRAGVGDVHAVQIVRTKPHLVRRPNSDSWLVQSDSDKAIDRLLEELKSTAVLFGHYRYAAFLEPGSQSMEYRLSSSLLPGTLAEDGVGRIGILFVDLQEDQAAVNPVLKPERFRSSKEIVELADKYVAEHTVNWEIRDEPASVS